MHIQIRSARGSLTFNDVAKQLEALPEALRRDAMRRGARGVATDVKRQLRGWAIPVGTRKVPRRMGRWTRWRRTRDTVKVWTPRARGTPKAYVQISGGIRLLEFGTRNMAPRKPVERTLQVVESRASRIYAQAINRVWNSLIRQIATGKLSKKFGRALADFERTGK